METQVALTQGEEHELQQHVYSETRSAEQHEVGRGSIHLGP